MAQKGIDLTMLQIINSDLFTVKTVEKPATDRYESHLIDEYYPTSSIKIDADKRPDYKFFPITRVHLFDEDGNLSVRCRKNEKTGKTQTQLQMTNRAKYDTNAFLIAVPFCGILLPMDQSKYLRIHSATVMRSDEGATVEWDGRNYTTVVYLLATLDVKAMENDNVEDVVMTFVSKVPKKVDGKKEFYTNILELTIGVDGSYTCSDIMEDPEPDIDFVPSSDEPRKKAFVLYEAPEYKRTPKAERHFIGAAPDDASSAAKYKGKKTRK